MRTENSSKPRNSQPWQSSLVLPASVVKDMARNPMLSGIYPTAAGRFPKASGHFTVRRVGIADCVMILCTAGEGWLKIGGSERVGVAPHQIAIIPPFVEHSYGATPGNPWSITWAHVQGQHLEAFLSLLRISPEKPVISLLPGVVQRLEFEKVYQSIEHDYTLPNLLMSSSRLRMVLCDIHQSKLSSTKRALTSDEAIEQTVEWMKSHVDGKFAIEELAEMAGLSKTHYATMFRKKVGYSPINYILRLKVHASCNLLHTTSLSIKEIAHAVGFTDPYYFSRVFQKIMAVSPTEHRNSFKR